MVDCKRGSQKGELFGSVGGLFAGLALFRGKVGLSQPRTVFVTMGCVILGGQCGNIYSRHLCAKQFLQENNSQVGHIVRHLMLNSLSRETFVDRYDIRSKENEGIN